MATPQGPSTRGNAGVFGGSINPLGLYIQQGASRHAREAYVMEQERKKRDEALEDARKWNPDKVWDPFNEAINKGIQSHVRDKGAYMFDAGVPTNTVQRELSKAHGEWNGIIGKVNGLKDISEQTHKSIDSNNFIADKGYYHSKLNDIEHGDWLNAAREAAKTGQMRPVDTNTYQNLAMADPKGWDVNKIVSEHLKGLPEQIKTQDAVWKDDAKEGYRLETISNKLGWQKDALGRPIMDARTHQPLVSLTDDVYHTSMQNPYLKVLVDNKVGPNATEGQRRAAMQDLLAPHDAIKFEQKLHDMTKREDKDKWAKWGWGYNVNPDDLKARHSMLTEITDKWTPETLGVLNHVTKDVQVHYSDFKTDKQGNKVPTEIEIAYPSHLPETKEGEKPMTWQEAIMAGVSVKLSHKKLPLNTPQEREEARVQLSEHLDQFDQKRSLGDQYARFEQEMKSRQGTPGVKFTQGKTIPGFQ